MDKPRVLDEQQNYYRARAQEYDEWWERRGRYDRGAGPNRRWFDEIAEVRRPFDRLDLGGDVLELAVGTGYWTDLLSRRSRHVTAIDGAPEMLEVARARLGPAVDNVEFRQADLFEWQPERQWDAVVFCFWISHVPSSALVPFMKTCGEALRPGARLFMLDGRRTELSTAADHVLPEPDRETMTRRLNDGREFEIVKNFYEPDALTDAAAAAGIDLQVSSTSEFFQYATGTMTT